MPEMLNCFLIYFINVALKATVYLQKAFNGIFLPLYNACLSVPIQLVHFCSHSLLTLAMFPSIYFFFMLINSKKGALKFLYTVASPTFLSDIQHQFISK